MISIEGTYLAWLNFQGTSIQGSPYEFLLMDGLEGIRDGLALGGAPVLDHSVCQRCPPIDELVTPTG